MSEQKQTTEVKKPAFPTKGVEGIRQELKRAKAYDLIGNTVYWSISQFRMDHKKFVELLEQVGLDKKYARATTHKSTLTQVINEYVKELSRVGDGVKKSKVKVVDDDTRFGNVIVHTTVDSQNLSTSHETRTTAIIMKSSNTLVVEGMGEKDIRERFQSYLGTFNASQFRDLVKDILVKECGSVTIRESGGVYFTPIQAQDVLDKLEKLFELVSPYCEAGKKCQLETIPVPDLDKAKQSMWRAFMAETQNAIEELNGELGGMVAPTKRVLENRIQKLADIRQKVNMYVDLTAGLSSDLNEGLQKLQEKFLTRLGEVADEE